MANLLSVEPSHLEAFNAVNQAASATITTAGSADSAAMLQTAAAALGPIGAGYLAAYAPAQANNLAATLLVGALHAGVGAATEASKSAFIQTDRG